MGCIVGCFRRRWRLLAAVASGVLLAGAFPPWADGSSAWFALVPLLLIGRYSTPLQAFGPGWLAGSVYWCVTLTWMVALKDNGGPLALVLLGWFGLATYCALFTAFFSSFVAWVWREEPAAGMGGHGTAIARMTVIVLGWVGFEWLRSTLFTGFSWNQLGVSQYQNLPVLIPARLGGVYAVSAVVVMMNTALAMTGVRIACVLRRERISRRNIELMAALAVMALVLVSGFRFQQRLRGDIQSWSTARVGVIQPNAPAVFTRGAEDVIQAYGSYRVLAMVAGYKRPDLTVWPESALFDGWGDNPMVRRFVAELAEQARSPVLMGAMEYEAAPEIADGPLPGYKMYNSSVMVSSNAVEMGIYRKRHLVPFGEVLPFDKTFPALQRLGPLGVSCWPGEEATVFSIPLASGETLRFGTLICFEDAVPYVARDLLLGGATLLVSQSNDSWFRGSSEPLQHMSQCVLRCVENGVSAVRAASTGVSCWIDAGGGVTKLVRDGHETGFTSSEVWAVPMRPDGLPLTWYTRHGDWTFAIPCAIGVVVWMAWGLVGMLRRRLKK